MKRAIVLAPMLALPLVVTSCGDMKDDASSSASFALGDALAGTNAAQFSAGKTAFATSENAADGLGPIFNERGCGTCHQNGALGGAGQQIERRYGTLTNGVFDPLANTGGSLRQLFGLGGFNVGGLNCNSGTDANPAPGATIFAGRLTTPTFGLGLVDSLPDSAFDTLASREPSGVRGTANRVSTVLPNPADSSQSIGSTRVGRFGWKGGVPNLVQFSADAYLNEMGITTSHCFRGTRVSAFATENRANRAPTNAIINGCPDDAVPGTDEDAATEDFNNCAGGVTGIQSDVAAFAFFMSHLAPPPQVAITAGSAADRGRTLFNSASLQCASCHRDDADIFVSTSAGGVPAGVRFHPFSDFLVHDMGTLGDGIGNAGDSVAVTRRMRTAPLWGLRSRNGKLHDGRTTDIATAISAHNAGTNGQGTPAGQAFNALSSAQKSDLIAYLNTL
ncbi:MAG TPA: di-heme oxidoredictase family protein [Polyangia bacterium]|nr:di-heme oxidoredictase family protein [Polyangia bacterium]